MNGQSNNQFLYRVLSTSSIWSAKNLVHFFGIILLLSSLSACHDKAALKQALIEQTVKGKVANHQKKKKATCRKEALAEAIVIADSLMIKLALSKVDTSGQGNRPIKPVRPELELPVDTTPIKPLFEDTIVTLEDTTTLIEKPKLKQQDISSKDSIKKEE